MESRLRKGRNWISSRASHHNLYHKGKSLLSAPVGPTLLSPVEPGWFDRQRKMEQSEHQQAVCLLSIGSQFTRILRNENCLLGLRITHEEQADHRPSIGRTRRTGLVQVGL